MQKALFEYAKSKNDYQGRYDALKELYKDVEGADIDAELTADLVGDYLFTDSDFVNNLSVTNRNVFQKIYDEIKHLLKLVTAGSKEARQLEKVKKAFENAYREGGKSENNVNSKTDYSLSKDVNGEVFVDVTEDIFDGNDGESVARTIQRVIHERFNNIIDVHGQKIQINKTTNDEFRKSESAWDLLENNSQTYNDKLKTIANADEILSAAKNWIGEEIKHIRKDDIVEFARGNVMYRVGEHGYVADVIVGTRKNGSAVLYDLVNIYEKEIAEDQVTMASNNSSQRRHGTSADDIIPQNSEKSSDFAKNSLSFAGEAPVRNGTPLNDLRLDAPMQEDIGPVREDISQTETTTQNSYGSTLFSGRPVRFIYLCIFTRRSIDFESACVSASISPRVFLAERLMRIEHSICCGVRPNAVKAALTFCECDEQAEPLET